MHYEEWVWRWVDYLMQIGMVHIAKHEQRLTNCMDDCKHA